MPLALFDLDDTLTDRRASFRAWATDFATEHGLGDGSVHILEGIDESGYTPRPDFFRQLAERLAVRTAVDEMLVRYQREFATYTHGPSERALVLLRCLRDRGWRIGVVTNGGPHQAHKLEAAGLAGLVDGCCISEVEGLRKPDRRIFERAAQRCDAALAGGWMVGDHPEFDIRGAAECGLQTIWLRHGRDWGDRDFAPTVIVASLEEALQHLLALSE